MSGTVRYLDRQPSIRDELLKCAQAGETPFYKEFGKRVGIPPQGPWKPVLDLISKEETDKGLPDLTFLLIKKQTGFPGQIGFVRAKKPTKQQMELARQKLREVFDRYCPEAQVPF